MILKIKCILYNSKEIYKISKNGVQCLLTTFPSVFIIIQIQALGADRPRFENYPPFLVV